MAVLLPEPEENLLVVGLKTQNWQTRSDRIFHLLFVHRATAGKNKGTDRTSLGAFFRIYLRLSAFCFIKQPLHIAHTPSQSPKNSGGV